jgi:hypothetical protein
VSTALAEKISALAAGEYSQKRAARGGRRTFDRALSKVKNAVPDDFDRLSAGERAND